MSRLKGHTRTLSGSAIIAGAVLAVVCLSSVAGVAQVPPPMDPLSFNGPNPAERYRDISIDQRLDAQVPLDLRFTDESGAEVRLGDYLGDRPAILALVYYECPMLCSLVLDGLEGAIDGMNLKIGTDYDVITVSIDPDETPELAAHKKANHIERLGREGAEEGWHFLTGDPGAIDALADTVGFRYVYDRSTDQYAHAAGIMALTPRGKVARYFYGIEYIARDVKFGLTEASEGRIGNIVDQLILLCFAYDPTTGAYGFYIIGALRISFALMVLGFISMWTYFYFQSRKQRKSASGADPDAPKGAAPAGPTTG